jgi:DNA-binding MarR family transcriptional regulator
MARSPGATQRYFYGVADARFALRKVVRIVDDIAKRRGLDPLEHQALIQIYGARNGAIRVGELAERLDIPPEFASKLAKTLIEREFAYATPDPRDQRVTLLRASSTGRTLLIAIDRAVRGAVDAFAETLSPQAKTAALDIFGFYVGATNGRHPGIVEAPASSARKRSTP